MNVKSGKQHPVFQAHAKNINDVKFSTDGSVFATVSDDGTLVIWEIGGAEPICRLSSPQIEPLASCAFSPEGTKLVAGGKSGHILIWDLLPVADSGAAGTGDGKDGNCIIS